MILFGIDVGGSGIKGAPVDVERGALTVPYQRIPTPQPSTPEAVGDVVAELVRRFEWSGPVGCTFPAVIQQKSGCPFVLINDADAAGLAEMEYGAGRGQRGVVMMLTFGTGIGSALFVDGHLVPNTELGHMEIGGKEAEHRAADRVRAKKKLNWKRWAARVDVVLREFEALFSPNLFIVGGGVSKKYDRFLPLLTVRTPVVQAQLLNEAGIVGAALASRPLAVDQPMLQLNSSQINAD